MPFIKHSFQYLVLWNVSVYDNSFWIIYFRGRWALTVLRERVMSGHVHLTGELCGRNGTVPNRLVQLKHWYAERLTDHGVSLLIEILQCHFLKYFRLIVLISIDKKFWFAMILCLLRDVCRVHSAVGTLARLHKSEQFWFVFRQGVDIYEIKGNANLIQLGNFIDAFLARHVSGTYAHHQEH